MNINIYKYWKFFLYTLLNLGKYYLIIGRSISSSVMGGVRFKQCILWLSQALCMTNVGITINYSTRANKQVTVKVDIHVYVTISIRYEWISHYITII